jgi:hypothetical protein
MMQRLQEFQHDHIKTVHDKRLMFRVFTAYLSIGNDNMPERYKFFMTKIRTVWNIVAGLRQP